MFANVPYEKSKINIETLRASQSAIALESLNTTSVSSPGTAGSMTKGFSRSQENASVQASEKEIETFTEMTLNNSWILPQVAAPSPAKRSFGRKKGKELSNDDFKPVQLKTIVPKKYKNHAGTFGAPSQPTSVTFVPGLGQDAGIQGDTSVSQLSREFSSFDFSIHSAAQKPQSSPMSVTPSAERGRSPNVKKTPRVSNSSRSPSRSANQTPDQMKNEGSSPPNTPEIIRKQENRKVQSNNGKNNTKSRGHNSGIVKHPKVVGSGGKKCERESPEKRPQTGDTKSPPTKEPAPFFFPNLMGVPSSPVVLQFKPISLDDYV